MSQTATPHSPFRAAERAQLCVGYKQLAIRADREMLAGKLRQVRYRALRAGVSVDHHVRHVDELLRGRVPRRMSPIAAEEEHLRSLDIEADQAFPVALISGATSNGPLAVGRSWLSGHLDVIR